MFILRIFLYSNSVIGVVTGTQEDKWLAVSVDLIHRSIMVRLPKESGFKILEK
ncbi:MAG: hypothetical protein NTZ27_08205 [Ignavibacteriales bacterium]|nr:hypothetical protein [Ignavibacteriales bacterium]